MLGMNARRYHTLIKFITNVFKSLNFKNKEMMSITLILFYVHMYSYNKSFIFIDNTNIQ